MKKPAVTTKQKEILLLLFKFRFLHTHHIQKLLHHKNANRTLSWLKDLREKDCVRRHYERKSFNENNKPAIYFLGPKARYIVQEIKAIELEQLEYIYQESRIEKKFIDHSLFIADIYLYLLSQKEKKEKLKFFTKADLYGYDYFPDPKPDAFISVEGDLTKRYFLDLFDTYTPPFVLRNRVRKYLAYAEDSDWDENTQNTQLPSILFICPNESLKKHVNKYATIQLEKTLDEHVRLYLTTREKIEKGENDIWEKVES